MPNPDNSRKEVYSVWDRNADYQIGWGRKGRTDKLIRISDKEPGKDDPLKALKKYCGIEIIRI